MKVDPQFPELDVLLTRLGVVPKAWSCEEQVLDPLEDLRRQLDIGIEIDVSQIQSTAGGLLTHKGQQVILYIKDSRKSRYILEHEKERAPRFHIWNCTTLQKMSRDGRQERYVVTTNKSGVFSLIATDRDTGYSEEIETSIHVCKNCLREANYEKYSELKVGQKKRIWLNFSLEAFFHEYATFFSWRPSKRDVDVTRGGYVREWSTISKNYRRRMQWTCEACGVNLREHIKLLHCHHRSGDVQDNSSKNLQALCVLCHAEQPLHGRMKPSTNARSTIEACRRNQDL